MSGPRRHPSASLPGAAWSAFAALVLLLLAGCATARPGRAVLPPSSIPSPASPEFTALLEDSFNISTSPSNQVRELPNGNAFYPAMLQAIRDARSDIRFETYLFWSGHIGTQFVHALSERAHAGVHVRLLLDWFGARHLSRRDVRLLRDAGVELRLFHAGLCQAPARLNHRDHRKLIIIDGHTGFTGGAGVADLWLGDAQRPHHWRDSMYRLRGPAVWEMARLFDDYWAAMGHSSHPHPAQADSLPPATPAGDELVQFLTDGGGDLRDPIYESCLLAIAAARHRIRLGMAYLVPPSPLRGALADACRRGVTVEIVVPGPHMDSWPVTPASRVAWGSLLMAGARVYRYKTSMYHAKVLIVDDAWVAAGSSNWDNRSFRFNDEVNFHVTSPAFAAEAVRQFELDRSRSQEVTLRDWQRRSIFLRLAEVFVCPFKPLL